MIPHLNLPQLSAEINSMTSNLSEEISKDDENAKEEEEENIDESV
jgi:hypothetical protein